MNDVSTAELKIPGYRFRLLREAEDFAERHFTDPDLSLDDAAVYLDVDTRTLREALAATGPGWRQMLRARRVNRGAELLAQWSYLIADVARLSGYTSASAFAKVFRQEKEFSPAAYRRAHKGPSRAGGATGAWARRQSTVRPGVKGGSEAVEAVRTREAHERLTDRSMMEHFEPWTGVSTSELAQELTHPRRLGDERARGGDGATGSTPGWRRTTRGPGPSHRRAPGSGLTSFGGGHEQAGAKDASCERAGQRAGAPPVGTRRALQGQHRVRDQPGPAASGDRSRAGQHDAGLAGFARRLASARPRRYGPRSTPGHLHWGGKRGGRRRNRRSEEERRGGGGASKRAVANFSSMNPCAACEDAEPEPVGDRRDQMLDPISAAVAVALIKALLNPTAPNKR
jgi:AraC-like DNA-binding protein